jgi:hypothetical protein
MFGIGRIGGRAQFCSRTVFIVWFLYGVLKRDKANAHVAQPREASREQF